MTDVKTWTVWYRDADGSLSDVFSSDEWSYLAHRRRAEFARKPTRKMPFTTPEVVSIPWTAIRKLTETEEG
jgi:hypothetical protein